MKASKQFIKSGKPILQWKVASHSEKGKYHLVGYFADGHYECSLPSKDPDIIECIGFETGHECRHIKRIKNKQRGLIYEPENYQRKLSEN